MSRAQLVWVATALALQSGQATLTVTAVPDQCARATAIELWRKSSDPISHSSDQPEEAAFWGTPLLGRGFGVHVWFTRIAREPVGANCRWSFSDLPDGDYVARLVRPDGSGGSHDAKVAAGTSQTIEIPAPTVTLSGQVTLDGLPHSSEIQIRDRSWTRPTVAVTADAAGRYTAVLDRPAVYTIVVRASARSLRGQVAQLREGVNELDIDAHTAAGPLALASLTAPDRALPDGCRVRSDPPSSFSSNPWIGYDRRVLVGLLGSAPASNMDNESLLHVREGYRAVYDSGDGSLVDVRAVRFDDLKHMPAAHDAPPQRDGNVRDRFTIDTTVIEIAADRQTPCSNAVETHLRLLK